MPGASTRRPKRSRGPATDSPATQAETPDAVQPRLPQPSPGAEHAGVGTAVFAPRTTPPLRGPLAEVIDLRSLTPPSGPSQHAIRPPGEVLPPTAVPSPSDDATPDDDANAVIPRGRFAPTVPSPVPQAAHADDTPAATTAATVNEAEAEEDGHDHLPLPTFQGVEDALHAIVQATIQGPAGEHIVVTGRQDVLFFVLALGLMPILHEAHRRDELQPLTDSQLAAHTQLRPAGDAEQAEACVVCQRALSKRHPVRELRCGHVFHRKCVDEWLQRPLEHFMRTGDRGCPMCRATVLPAVQAAPDAPPGEGAAAAP